VASHLGRLSDLHALALKQTKSETGILQRWFGPEPASSEPLSKDSLGETTELSLDTIAGCLMRLLDDIEPRNEMQSTLEIASDLLASGLAEDNMELAIQSVTDVVLSAMSSDRLEMTGYLTQMNERLQEATMGLSASQQLLKEERAVGQHFGRAMQESAQGMREEVSADHDLPALKACINQNLDLMMSAVDEHHNQGNSLQAALSEQLEALVNRAKVLEVQGQEAERRVAEQRRRALTDNLTGLPNREAYEETAAREVQRWQRYDRPLCLAVCDIDLFKAVNDSYGHAAGDEVLRQLASILGKRLRGTDFVARYGGEEFVVLLPETDREQAEGVMESLREGIEQSQIKWEKKDLQLTVSIGIADFKGKDILQSAFARADRALYQAKTNGRNQVQLALD
jgi:diguanylate cyclase